MNKLIGIGAVLVAFIAKSEILTLTVLLIAGVSFLYRIMSDRRY